MVGTLQKKKTSQSNNLKSYWDFNKVYALEEYFELEEKAPFRSEFHNGKIIPMSGGTIPHGDISGNVYFFLRLLFHMESLKFRAFHNDQKIYISEHNRSVYADAFVVTEDIEQHPSKHAISNPSIIFEVSSKSTESYDRGTKFRLYKTLPSFKEYVLINQKMPIVEVFHKITAEEWQYKTYIGIDVEVYLNSIGQSLKMEDIYKNVKNLKDPQSAFDFDE